MKYIIALVLCLIGSFCFHTGCATENLSLSFLLRVLGGTSFVMVGVLISKE